MIRRIVAGIMTAGAALALVLVGPTGAATPASANVPGEVSAVWNNSSRALNLGAIHIYDGSYGNGYYDGLLAPGERTDNKWAWGRAEAFFMSEPGYCYSVATQPINNPGAAWKFFGVLGPYSSGFAQQTPEGYLWQVKRWQVGDVQGACP
jgi:hypothetical protein